MIAWFLAAAVEQARIIFNDPRLAIHSEVKTPSVQIPNVGLVGGKLDELMGRLQARLGKTKEELQKLIRDLWSINRYQDRIKYYKHIYYTF